jgi:ankyrin repeat protein
MAASGYIYILINPSMPGLLKIGKTCRTSDIRAEELSGDTGVPANFIVAFEAPVSDCDAAESEVHRELANFRSNQNREFFKISLRHAVRAVSEIAAKFTTTVLDADDHQNREPSGSQPQIQDGLTPLHRACISDDADRVSALLARGADPDSKTEDGVTPLMMAAGKGHSRIIDLLIRAGANTDAVAADGATPAGIAKERGHIFALNVLNYYSRGLGESEPAGSTPLLRASARKDLAQVEALLREGADPNIRNEAGDAALDIAARCGATKVAELLLRYGSRSPKAAGLAEANGHFVTADLLRRASAPGEDGADDESDGS